MNIVTKIEMCRLSAREIAAGVRHRINAPMPNPKNATHWTEVNLQKLDIAYIMRAPDIPMDMASCPFPAIILNRKIKESLKMDFVFNRKKI